MAVQRICAVGFTILLLTSMAASAAIAYPQRPLRFIVPSAPGGSPDINARLLAAELSKQLGQQIVVDNRPGASGVIGLDLIIRSSPDGYTLGYGTSAALASNLSVLPKAPYDPIRDLQMVAQLGNQPNLLGASMAFPFRTLPELIDYAKANPGKTFFGSSGNGTSMHLTGELLKLMTGTRMVHVPYKAAQQAITDIIGGQVHFIFDNMGSIVGHVRAVNYITLARVLLPLAFIAPPLLAGVGSRTAVAMWAVSLPTLALIIYVPLRRMIGAPRGASDGGLYRRLVGTGTKLAVGNSALLANSRISLIALAAFKSDATVGVYSVAIAASEMLYLTTYSLASSSFRGIGSSERAASIRLTARSVRHALLLSSVGGVLIVPAAFIGLHLIVGGGYGDVPSIMLLLIPGVVGQAGFWTLHTFFTVQLGRPTIINRISVATMATNVAFTLALVPPFGAWGAAAAATVGNAVAALLSFTNFRRHAGIPIRKLRPGRAELADYVTLARALRARIRAARA